MPKNTIGSGPSIEGELGDADDPRRPVDELTRVHQENDDLKRRLREFDDRENDAADKERREAKEQEEQAERTKADLERLEQENEQLKAALEAAVQHAEGSSKKTVAKKSTPAAADSNSVS